MSEWAGSSVSAQREVLVMKEESDNARWSSRRGVERCNVRAMTFVCSRGDQAGESSCILREVFSLVFKVEASG